MGLIEDRNELAPTRYSPPLGFLALALFTSVLPKGNATPIGIYFTADTPVVFSDSYWTVVTDIQFDSADKLVIDIKRWLNDRVGKSFNETMKGVYKVAFDPDPLQNLP